MESVNEAYTSYCISEHIISEFVRYHPLLHNWKNTATIYEQIHLGDTATLDLSSEEIIWKNITSKNRNMIRKAQKNGLKTYLCRTPDIIAPFEAIYNQTMNKDQADTYYYFETPFYKSILNDLKDNAMWFYTEKDDEIAAIAIILFCNGNIHYHLSASRR
ncbi:MAG: peptidoglycan bridge formation glycyltransferase FemA/FemB family protein, partial [Treponemataceae bacterium]